MRNGRYNLTENFLQVSIFLSIATIARKVGNQYELPNEDFKKLWKTTLIGTIDIVVHSKLLAMHVEKW